MEEDFETEIEECVQELCSEFVSEASKELLNELQKKKIWTRDWILRRNNSTGLIAELRIEDPKEFKAMLRMSPDNFDFLLEKATPFLEKQDTNMREALPPKLKLEITLTFLATGAHYRTLQHMFRVSKSSIQKFVPEVCETLYFCLKEFIQFPSSEEDWKRIEKGFRTKWNFPGCYGAVDGKHVLIRAPANSGTTFFNYKKTFSTVLLALVDYDYKFVFLDVGSNGSVSDSTVYHSSTLFNALNSGILPEGGVIIGDDAFPLKANLMKPYPGLKLSYEEKIFNYRLSRARRVVENAFGILAMRFRIFERPMLLMPKHVDKIILATCALHNFLRSESSSYIVPNAIDHEDVEKGELIFGSWRQEVNGIPSVKKFGSHQQTRQAKEKRQAYKSYFVNEGAVDWQEKMIH